MLPEQEEPQEKQFNWMSAEILLPLITLIFMILFIGRLGTFDLDIAQSIFFGFSGLGWFSQLVMDEFKHKTRKVVLPTGFTTFNGEFMSNKYSNYGIIKAGTIRALNMEIDEISEGIIIFPIDCIKKTGKCAVIQCDTVKKVKLKEIDDRLIVAWLIKNSIKEPYYMCRNYSKKYLRKPDINKLIDIMHNMSDANEQLENKIRSKFDMTEGSVSAGSRIRDIATELKRDIEKYKKPSE